MSNRASLKAAMLALSRLRTTALGNDFVNEHDLRRDVECIESALELLAECGRAGCPTAAQATSKATERHEPK